MTDFRAVLLPLLFISYVAGTRIIEFPAGEPRSRLSSIYILLLWSVYFFLYAYTVFHYVRNNYTLYHVCFWLDVFTTLLSTALAVYYDKKLRSCLRKLAIVENTLEKVGTMTDYEKLYTRVLFIIFGWFTLVIFKTYNNSLMFIGRCEPVKAFYIASIIDYCPHINLIDDLIIASILGYIEQKFDQINEHFRKLNEDNDEVKRIWEHFAISTHQVDPRDSNNECVSWIVIHLHLELRRISRELNSIFGLQLTIKMGSYFTFLALSLKELVFMMVVDNYIAKITLAHYVVALTLFLLYMFRLVLINYMCERVTVKANATGDLINKISYTSSDIIVRENISQLLLQLIQAPVRFYGLGLFQFGLKFLNGFYNSIMTVTVILIQSSINGNAK